MTLSIRIPTAADLISSAISFFIPSTATPNAERSDPLDDDTLLSPTSSKSDFLLALQSTLKERRFEGRIIGRNYNFSLTASPTTTAAPASCNPSGAANVPTLTRPDPTLVHGRRKSPLVAPPSPDLASSSSTTTTTPATSSSRSSNADEESWPEEEDYVEDLAEEDRDACDGSSVWPVNPRAATVKGRAHLSASFLKRVNSAPPSYGGMMLKVL
ncbi:hypothetical protein HK101_005669 [Irineochytrium annulatum]|nr:hypothetical protein HK101_005669 [Irineochytrium annulatum]